MTTGPYRVMEVEDAGNAGCTCDNCGWTGTADETCDIQDCALTPGDSSPVGRCPECDGLSYLNKPLREESFDKRLLDMVNALDQYLREIRAENLDGSEPELGELLEQSLSLRLALSGEPVLQPISASGNVKSISDDDLCSGCAYCIYNPGELSGCKLDWPGLERDDGYVISCKQFKSA